MGLYSRNSAGLPGGSGKAGSVPGMKSGAEPLRLKTLRQKKHTIRRLGNYLLRYRLLLCIALVATGGKQPVCAFRSSVVRICDRRHRSGNGTGGF